jgi:hypothetical protein
MVDYAAVHRQARAVLDLLDRTIDTRAEVAALSVAQTQIVEIAKALSLEARFSYSTSRPPRSPIMRRRRCSTSCAG